MELFGKQSVVRSRDLEQYEIPRIEISRLCRRGIIQRVGRGLLSTDKCRSNRTPDPGRGW
ncbi:type IV toxin-antitoxin system AbiEi family antitoxin domain-containing protein [Oryzomonas rubra]|uniref:AbiEi antitoxin N-terminal domain-containing protein n=1 Tax=Oryzomonas rubra TaxID=2509454 RepID=A0A5A9XMF1_9BACT|nr:hypothetical protein ET418_03690 [Oryzomonas rubra]